MTPGENVSFWIARLKDGDPAAAQQLWEGYFRRLVGLARVRLQGAGRGIADEEDVALSAFASFCRGAERQRFPNLSDRNDLWKLLVVITARKAGTLLTREGRQKRGGGVPHRSIDDPDGGPGGEPMCPDPSPEFAVELAEEYHRLLDALGDDELRRVAVRKVEGYSNQEIADEIRRSVATVERKLRLIRQIWEAARPPAGGAEPAGRARRS